MAVECASVQEAVDHLMKGAGGAGAAHPDIKSRPTTLVPRKCNRLQTCAWAGPCVV